MKRRKINKRRWFLRQFSARWWRPGEWKQEIPPKARKALLLLIVSLSRLSKSKCSANVFQYFSAFNGVFFSAFNGVFLWITVQMHYCSIAPGENLYSMESNWLCSPLRRRLQGSSEERKWWIGAHFHHFFTAASSLCYTKNGLHRLECLKLVLNVQENVDTQWVGNRGWTNSCVLAEITGFSFL